MFSKPFITVPVLIFLLLGSIFLLPQRGKSAGSAVEVAPREMQLPMSLGSWQGVPRAESEAERKILSKDTRFAKAEYLRKKGTLFPIYDRITTSIVLSGSDLANSIHRPERCLPAQGHYNLNSTSFALTLEDGHKIPITRLRTLVKLASKISPEQEQAVEEIEVDKKVVKTLTYYFFVGHDSITHNHYTRTLTDMKDRLLHGRDQRWAYVQFGIHYGDPELGFHLTEEAADEAVKELLKQLVPKVVNWEQIESIDSVR